MPRASIIVPAYNTLATLPETVASLCAQTFTDLEIIVVDDGSSDGTASWVAAQSDPRIVLVRQVNRGLAGARNGGIAVARGRFIGFCDGDDLWAPEKLETHIAFLEAHPEVGLTYSGSALIDAAGRPLGVTQTPKAAGVTARDVLLRNPVGNGSAPVLRRAALEDIAFRTPGEPRDWWFDERLRQSEDIDCWLRLALTTRWQIAGTARALTYYRILPSGLSANLMTQYETWRHVADRIATIAPEFARRNLPAARAYQFRYLARRAVSLGAGGTALWLLARSLRASCHPLLREPGKTLTTLAAAVALVCGGRPIVARALGARRA